jgi:hypothetical protein
MPSLLFSLRGVPDDEAEDIRGLLNSNGIRFYETSPSPWGISSGAMWLRDETDLPRAKSLVADYQKERFGRKRAEYEQLKKEGRRRTILDIVREDPLRFALYIAIMAAVLYFSIKPFLAFRG